MTLDEIATAIIKINENEEYFYKLCSYNIPTTIDKIERLNSNLKFYGDLENLKLCIEKTKLMDGLWRTSDNNLFTQLILMGNNVNFYKTGTILIQGNPSYRKVIKNEIIKAMQMYQEKYK